MEDQQLRQLRDQRHQFINELQVIHSMIQLGLYERAIRHIEKIAADPEAFIHFPAAAGEEQGRRELVD